MKKITACFFLLSLGLFAQGQIVLMHEDVKSDSVVSRFGPNRTHYLQTYYGFGYIFGEPDSAGAEIRPWKSWFLQYGFRHKLKLGRYYAVGFDFYYQMNSYRLKQNPEKVLPDSVLHEKERLVFHNASGAFFNRINFKKRGDIIGNFFDFGVYADYVFGSTHFYRDKDPAGSTSDKTSTRRHGLVYVNDYNYGAFVRIGWNGFALWGQYRLADIFDKNYAIKYPELPRILVGIQISTP